MPRRPPPPTYEEDAQHHRPPPDPYHRTMALDSGDDTDTEDPLPSFPPIPAEAPLDDEAGLRIELAELVAALNAREGWYEPRRWRLADGAGFNPSRFLREMRGLRERRDAIQVLLGRMERHRTEREKKKKKRGSLSVFRRSKRDDQHERDGGGGSSATAHSLGRVVLSSRQRYWYKQEYARGGEL
ncbi:hypothetical protein JCM10207_002117 [Rhodosporidiobolus poonsookiae]